MLMATDLSPHRVVVVVFYMEGCEACEEYLPRLQKIARKYGDVPTMILEANQYGPYADSLGVQAVPATYVLKRPAGGVKVAGSIPDGQIEYLYGLALREARVG